VGIFVALALGLNIVVGLAGLLDLGYVAFFAVGAYSWAIFGSPHANIILGGGFPLAGWWFYVFLLVGLTVAATTGILLGLPLLRVLCRRHGRAVLGQAGLHQPGVVHVPGVDRRARHGHPGGHGIDSRCHRRRHRSHRAQSTGAQGVLALAQ